MLPDTLLRIENWLAAHAPRILHESLNPGAPEAALAALGAAVGRPLPAEYQALYRWHDGLDEDAENLSSFVYGLSFLPLETVAATYRSRAVQAAVPLGQASPGLKAGNVLNPYWLSLGFDGAHTWLYLDLDPTEAGTYGQVIFLDEEAETAFRVADSVGALLTEFAADLEQGLYALNPDALAEDDNEFLLPVASIELVNWQQAARWQHALHQ